MLPYFKKYVIAVCAIAVLLLIVASTLWPLMTGQIMAASLLGMVLQFVLFFGGLLIGYVIFERRAERVADGYLYLYDVDCNPEALISHGSALARAITFPCNGSGAWFLSSYAQACLDVGRMDEARTILSGLRESVSAQKKPAQKVEIIMYLIPLEEKMGTLAEVSRLIEEGIHLVSEDASPEASVRRDYLTSQRVLANARASHDYEKLVKLDDAVVSSSAYPMRIRVEYAWDAASACFKLKDEGTERKLLSFIVDHGGSLALVARAKERLSHLGQ